MSGLGIDDSLRGRQGRISVTHIEHGRRRCAIEGNVDGLGRITVMGDIRGDVGLRKTRHVREIRSRGVDLDRGAIEREGGAGLLERRAADRNAPILVGIVGGALRGRALRRGAWWRGADGSARRLVVRVDLAMQRHDEGRGSKVLLWCSGRRKVRVMNAKHVTSVSKNVFDSLEVDLFQGSNCYLSSPFFGNR